MVRTAHSVIQAPRRYYPEALMPVGQASDFKRYAILVRGLSPDLYASDKVAGEDGRNDLSRL